MGFSQELGVNNDGQSGGLTLFWKKDIGLSIISYFKHHIQATITNDSNKVLNITGVYGHLEASRRNQVWELLKSLHIGANTPWLLFGDFNEILSNEEKCGGP